MQYARVSILLECILNSFQNQISLVTMHLLVRNPPPMYQNPTKTFLKLKQKREREKTNHWPNILSNGTEVYRPYPHTGYIRETGGKTPDPNSNRQKTRKKGGNCGKGPRNKGPSEDSQPTVEAPHLTVQEFAQTHSLDSKICAPRWGEY